MKSIAAILSYCTNEYRYLKKCIEELQYFADQIIVSVCDHFFDGTPENRDLLQQTYEENPEVTFIEYAYDPSRGYSSWLQSALQERNRSFLWHSTGRYIPYFYLRPSIETIFFVDADEIFDGKRFKKWLDTQEYTFFSAIRFSAYLYFREAHYLSKVATNGCLMIAKKELESPSYILDEEERMGLFLRMPSPKQKYQADPEGSPFIHHYSWVKTREEIQKKTQTWGHRNDRDWDSLIKKEFCSPFQGRDFFGQDYTVVTPYFDPMQVKITPKKIKNKTFPHVIKVNREIILRKEIESYFDTPYHKEDTS